MGPTYRRGCPADQQENKTGEAPKTKTQNLVVLKIEWVRMVYVNSGIRQYSMEISIQYNLKPDELIDNAWIQQLFILLFFVFFNIRLSTSSTVTFGRSYWTGTFWLFPTTSRESRKTIFHFLFVCFPFTLGDIVCLFSIYTRGHWTT